MERRWEKGIGGLLTQSGKGAMPTGMMIITVLAEGKSQKEEKQKYGRHRKELGD